MASHLTCRPIYEPLVGLHRSREAEFVEVVEDDPYRRVRFEGAPVPRSSPWIRTGA